MEKMAAVTTPRGRGDLAGKAREAAAAAGIPMIPRNGMPIRKILDDNSLAGLLIVNDGAPIIQTRLGPIAYHEGSAVLRTHRRNDRPDALVRAMKLDPDSTVLDATLGMGIDALVAASALTGDGRLVGLETSKLLYTIVEYGLRNHGYKTPLLQNAAAKIEPVLASHDEYLAQCAPGQFDVVYFDPMFVKSVQASTMMRRIREVAEEKDISAETVELAKRAARWRVVMKGRRGYFNDIEFTEFIPSGGTVFYGVIEL